MVWGLSTLLYFDRSPLADQFICWLILAGLAMFSINSLSSHLGTLRSYLDTLALSALGVMLWRIGVDLQFRGPYYHYWIIALLLIFWQVLRQAGLRLHMTHRKNFELQFRNNQLIESLTRQTQAALEAVEIKNRFLASAAHDIRQPVHALSLYADWLGSEPELVHEIAPKIVESTKAVNALFDSLFDLVRLDSGKIKLNIEPVDLGKLLHDLELQYRPLAQAKGLQFRIHVAPGTVVSDPILLRRIVGNLVSNAVKYTQRGGVLAGVARHGGGLAHRDLGHRRGHRAGAPARNLPRVLQGSQPRRNGRRLRPGAVHRGAAGGHPGPPAQPVLDAGTRDGVPADAPAHQRAAGGRPGRRRGGSAGQHPVSAGVVDGLGAALDAQAAEQAPQVDLDGVLADAEFVGDFAIRQAPVEHDDQLLLAL